MESPKERPTSARSIPGFVYDEAKKKYFKIHPNHVGPGASSYSREAVRRFAEEKTNFVERAKFLKTKQETSIQPSNILQHPLGGALALRQELGYRTSFSSLRACPVPSSWARGLVARIHSQTPVNKIVYNPTTCEFYYGLQPEHAAGVSLKYKDSLYGSEWRSKRLDALISSMTLSSNHQVLLVTTICESGESQAHLIWLDGTGFELRYQNSREGSIWCSAASRSQSNDSFSFALGGENQLVVISARPRGNIPFSQLRTLPECGQNHVRAVDWLDTNVVISGLRNGHVYLWDTRAGEGIGAISHRITHGSSVCHARALNPNQIIVSGIKNRLNTYDLRSLPTTTTNTNITNLPTKPYLNFPAYRNAAHNSEAIGFDIAPPLNLVAAATDKNRILLFEASTGKQVQLGEINSNNDNNKKKNGNRRGIFGRPAMRREEVERASTGGGRNVPGVAKCVRFVDVEGEGSRVPKLVIVAGKVVEEWMW